MFTVGLMTAVLWGPSLGPGDHQRKLVVDGRSRNYLVHVPPQYDPQRPTPVVIALHGGGVNAAFTVATSGLNRKADQDGFVVVYPEGTGFGPFLTWNAGGVTGWFGAAQPNDVRFLRSMLDDLECRVNLDARRVYATGLSNGGMMCYRLAAEMSDRIAAIAPIAGTQARDFPLPERAVSIVHFHGTRDNFVPPNGPDATIPSFLTFKSVAETLQIWSAHNGCPLQPTMEPLPDLVKDGTTVQRQTYAPGRAGSEVVYYRIEGGGHTWPGEFSILSLAGRITYDIRANDVMWEFFQQHPLPE